MSVTSYHSFSIMNKGWVFLNRRSDDYMSGLQDFIGHSLSVAAFEGNIKCPCRYCCNRFWKQPGVVLDHILYDGMDPIYANKPWTAHGESLTRPATEIPNATYGDMPAMLHDAFGVHGFDNLPDTNDGLESHQEPTHDAKNFYRLVEEGEIELYPGCGKSKLSFLVGLYQIKCLSGWSDTSMSNLLAYLKKFLPKGETLPSSFFKAKKIITDLGLSYEKIDECENHCMLYWKSHVEDTSCKVCGASRYKARVGSKSGTARKVANNVLRYLPLGPRLQRLYMSRHTAESMVWHAEHRQKDGVLRHPADTPAWEKLDTTYPEFGSESRNIRLGLASDGFNPFGMMSLSHSTWPVVMTVYNLPPWLCMKQPYLMLSLLIPGPKAPGNYIDVYLQPLIDELKTLWVHGLPTFDAFKQETFIMRAAVMWTINDFPAYAMLSGWSTKGKKACPHCAYGTDSLRLKHGKKFCYLGHRRWLPIVHRYRTYTRSFNGHTESRLPPIVMSGAQCLASLSGLRWQFGMGKQIQTKRKRGSTKNACVSPWKKRSIFFDLPYWKDLLIRHNLDVMHIEKNVTENVLGTLLGMDRKNKDSLNARLDLMELNIKDKLHPKTIGERTVFCGTAFTLKKKEKELLCKVLASVRLPDGFSSNIARCVREKENKLVGLKSHDCHIIMQYLLPIGVRCALSTDAVPILLELSSFFRNLCTKVGTAVHFRSLSKRVAVLLCELEKLLPPAFFVIMLHLLIHLPDEAAIAGPVHYRWMYPIERFLYTLKKYVRNKSRPEGSIVEGYIVEECLSFCAMYLGDDTVQKRNKPGRNADAQASGMREGFEIFKGPGKSLGRVESFHLDHQEWDRAHRHVLWNTPEVQPYIREHVEREKATRRPRVTVLESQRQAHKSFPEWFHKHIYNQILNGVGQVSDDIRALASGPRRRAGRWTRYIMNGFRFHVKSVADGLKSQNSGVFVSSQTDSYATARDPNPRSGIVDYYGVLKDIIELDYGHGRNVVLFDCDWINPGHRNGLKTDKFGFTWVNFMHLLPPPDTFILGSQALQVFYVQHPTELEWHAAVRTRPRDYFDMGSITKSDISAPQTLDDAINDTDEVEGRSDVEVIW